MQYVNKARLTSKIPINLMSALHNLAWYTISDSNIPTAISCKRCNGIQNKFRISDKSIAAVQDENAKYHSWYLNPWPCTSPIHVVPAFALRSCYPAQMSCFIASPAVTAFDNHEIQHIHQSMLQYHLPSHITITSCKSFAKLALSC